MRRSIRALLFFLFLLAVLVTGRVTAKGANYNFSLNATVSGTAGEQLSGQIYTLNLGSTKLGRTIPFGTDITSWFSGQDTPNPVGLRVVVCEDAEAGSSSIKIEFKGLVYGASQDKITMTVPIAYFDNTCNSFSYVADVNLSGNAKYNIIRNFTKPSNYAEVGYGIYFDKSQNSGKGFKLAGTKGQALTGSGRELNVLINGCFLRGLAKGTDITSWFTGHVISINSFYNTSVNSQLPPGVVVKLKNEVKVGDNSFTMVFSGTPEKGSRDIIAITIPAGYVTYNPGNTSNIKGDLQDALKTYNVSGDFVYDIESPDNDYKSVYILATYPDTTIHAGTTYTEEDGLIVKYQMIGSDSNGIPYKFKDITIGNEMWQYVVQNTTTGDRYEPISKTTGMTVKISKISDDRTYMEATITGTAKKPIGLLLPIGTGSGMQLLHQWSTYDKYIDFVGSEETHLYLGQPDPQITISEDIVIESTMFDKTPTFSGTTFTINLGNDTFAKSFSKGDYISAFAYKYSDTQETTLTRPEKEWQTRSSWNNLALRVTEAASIGSKQLKVEISSCDPILTDYYGYVYMALPRSYLTKATTYSYDGQFKQESYPIENSRIFLNVQKFDNYYAKASNVKLEGSVHIGHLRYDELVEDPEEESGYRVAGTFTKETCYGGIGKGKVSFTVETLQDINVTKDYAAGASVKDLVRINKMTVETSPFQHYIESHSSFYEYWESYYDIHTEKAIAKDNEGENKAHTFELYFDLIEIQAQQASNSQIILEIYDGKGWRKVYTSYGSVFDIDGEHFYTKDEAEFAEFKKAYCRSDSSNASGSAADSGYPVDFENKEGDVIIYARDASGKTVNSTYFNLTQEKIASGISYKCYSLDGGSKWKETSKFTDKQIDAMLKKGMTLSIANKYDKKTKKPAEDAVIYTFDTINKRPAAPKLKAEFKTYADPTGYTPGQWTLADKSYAALSKDELTKYEIGIAGTDKKTVSSAGYSDIPLDTGMDFEMSSGKTADSTLYFVRTKATEDTPASKAAKLTVKGQGKASKLKVDYKKEILKVKKGMIVFFGDTLTEDAAELKDEPKNYGDYSGKYIMVDEALAKSGIDISGYITDTRNTIMVWTAATEKKASTVAQVIKLAKRDSIKAEKLTVTGGKLKLDKKYEVYDEAKSKWGGLPKITESCELKIRLKATAKGGTETDSNYAASNTGTLKITYDVIDANKNKSGITSAEIVID